MVFAETMTESQKIDRIIMKIKKMENAEFIRNGESHTPQEAADHIRLKLGKAGNRIKTAKDFIKYCGTGSSITGEPYRIKFRNGSERLSADILNDYLKDIDAGN